MELFLTRNFIKSYENIPKKYQDKIREALNELKQDSVSGKKLSGNLEGHYSLRVGKYRILYTIRNAQIFAETVNHRKEVYR